MTKQLSMLLLGSLAFVFWMPSLLGQQSAHRYAVPLEAKDQLELELTRIPPGQGALFVPALLSEAGEPALQVYFRGTRVAQLTPGKRQVLPPGDYEVCGGEAAKAKQACSMATVSADESTVITPFYSLLIVTAIDPDGYPLRVSYVLKELGSAELYPVETTPDDETPPKRWLLPKGAVRLTLGDDPSAEKNVVTIPSYAGAVLRYRLVVDDGQLVRTELDTGDLQRKQKGPWTLRWLLGGDVLFGQAQQQLTSFNGLRMQLTAFSDFEAGLDTGIHQALLSLRLAESWLGFEPELGDTLPFRKLRDELYAELLYSLRAAQVIGLYARGDARLAAFESQFQTASAVTLESGERSYELGADDEFTLFSAGFPLFVQTAVGAYLTPLDNEHVRLALRAGPALRWSFFDDGFVLEEREDGVLFLRELDDAWFYGAELGASLMLRFGELLSLTSSLDVFMPSEQVLGDEDLRPLFRFDNVLGLRLNTWAMLVYTATLHLDDPQLAELQFIHSASLRLHYSVF
ncbi:MAG: hypothetical protein RBU37_09250 [Myxococcota bacterium]|jgi:hypothetical protein|nr:hypothetical protein [Myxococcota bacterium]